MKWTIDEQATFLCLESANETVKSPRRTSPRKEDKKLQQKAKLDSQAKAEEKDVKELGSSLELKDEAETEETSQDEDHSGDEESPFGGMSLDVLAQVATDRLELEPKKKVCNTLQT